MRVEQKFRRALILITWQTNFCCWHKNKLKSGPKWVEMWKNFEFQGFNSIFLLFNDAFPLKTLIMYYTMLQVLNRFQTFPKSFPDFCWFLNETSKEKEVGAGVKWFFEINFFLIDVMLKKWGKNFFLRNRKQLRSNILVEDVSLYLPSNHKVKGPCPCTMA